MSFSIIQIPSTKNFTYFWIVFSIYFVFQFITAIIANYFDAQLTSTNFHFSSLKEEFVIVVIVAPIIETLIFQYLIIETLLSVKLAPLLCVVVSALLFGISHYYNLAYILVTTVVGFIFAYYYMALRHQHYLQKIVLVTLLHALSNLFAFVNNNFYDFTNW
ncbi:CPBP family glutamic-type intramembrane protease [Pedobacter sp. MW01-1-1]|uniref:CPBP family glutamic-type intramembrane protease n=1 Tax=Pedobacter sp. MW01-1-1 TaxID=3383027 RepID=UPI003FEE2C71